MKDMLLRVSDIVVYTFSVTNRESFECIKQLRDLELKVKADTNMKFPFCVILGLKTDLEKERNIERSEGEEMAKSLVNCLYVEPSIKNIDDATPIFCQIIQFYHDSLK